MQNAKDRFIDRTLEVWQPLTSRPLNNEDARQIAENVSGFFRILLEWDEIERQILSSPVTTQESQPHETQQVRPTALIQTEGGTAND